MHSDIITTKNENKEHKIKTRYMQKSIIKAFALLSASALFLASCASTSSSSSAPETLGKAEEVIDILSKSESEIGVGGILRLRSGMPTNFNIHSSEGNPRTAAAVIDPMAVSLIKVSSKGEFLPNEIFLKDFKQTSQSPQTIEYNLVPGNVWSDGTPIDYKSAQNVFKFRKDPAYKDIGGVNWKGVESVERGNDDYHVVIKLKPGEFVGEYFDLIDVVPDQLVSTPEMFNTGWKKGPAVVGGPYKLEKLDALNGNIVLTPNEKFKGARKAKFSAISFQVIRDYVAGAIAFNNDQLDAVAAGVSSIYSTLKPKVESPGYVLRSGPGDSWFALAANGSSGRVLSDLNLRKAVFYAVDRSKIFAALFGTLPYPKDYSQNLLGNRVISQHKAGYQDNAGEFKKDANVEAAKKSIEQSGWTMGSDGYYQKDGKTLEIGYTYSPTSDASKTIVPLLIEDLKNVGIKVNPEPVNGADFFSKYINTKRYDLTVLPGSPVKFSTSGAPVHTTKGRQNYTGIGDPRVDALYEKIGKEPDATERIRMLNEIDKILWELAAPMPLFQTMDFIAMRDDIANYGIDGLASPDWTMRGYIKESPRVSEIYKP